MITSSIRCFGTYPGPYQFCTRWAVEPSTISKLPVVITAVIAVLRAWYILFIFSGGFSMLCVVFFSLYLVQSGGQLVPNCGCEVSKSRVSCFSVDHLVGSSPASHGSPIEVQVPLRKTTQRARISGLVCRCSRLSRKKEIVCANYPHRSKCVN